jgi:cytochrome P450
MVFELEENPMKTGRRFFLSSIAATLAGATDLLAAGQRHVIPGPPISQLPDASGSTRGDDPVQPPRSDPKVQLKEDQKILRRDVDRLLQLVKDLKAESDNTPETDVLSLSLVKKTEDIEKLARQIRDRIRSS